MSRTKKKLVFLAADCLIVLISYYSAVALRYGNFWPFSSPTVSVSLLPVVVLISPAVILLFGLHRAKLHTIESDATVRIAMAAAMLSLAGIAASYLLNLSGPRSVPLIFGIIFFVLALSTRIFGLYALRHISQNKSTCLPVIIYGAGAAGIQLAAALRQSVEARPILFVDDNPTLHRVVVAGLEVRPPSELPHLIEKYGIARILLAIPSLSEQSRNELYARLTKLPVEVQVLPSFIDLMSGRSLQTSLRPVSPDELLDRDKVELDSPEIAKAYAGRVVMVTGAGGSIGSELCRQLINCRPTCIVLFEQCEYALYAIELELSELTAQTDITVLPRLGSVKNRGCVARVVAEENVDIILHAAAYKHVPLVEHNEIEAASNNVIGTKIVADVANQAGIERFILVSTDKAVRPTSIMGATKRMAELVVQDIQTRAPKTRYAMVRFGNVLGSSGSVLPLFQKQIASGGPLTVTHPDVTRFFMTIPEAARLVLLAGAYAQGGDVFVLDMGRPQKIIDVAKRMIALSGRKLKETDDSPGDIKIEITGLRPGEKLYEELLITENLSTTPHAKILRAEEVPLSEIEVASLLRSTEAAIASADPAALRRIIEGRVEGYHLPIHASALA